MYDPEHALAEELVEVDELWALVMNEKPKRRILLGRAISLKYADRLTGHIDAKWHQYLNSMIIYHKTRFAPSDLECLSERSKRIYEAFHISNQGICEKTMNIAAVDQILSSNCSIPWALQYEIWPCIRHRVQLNIKPPDVSSKYVHALYNLRKNWWSRIHPEIGGGNAYLLLASPHVGEW
jgi:hypothetical protein